MNTVCVPWRPGDRMRDTNWEFAKNRWEDWGFEVRTADRPDEEFSIGRSRNDAASFDWDVILVSDADILLGSRDQAIDALETARKTGCYVTPYWRYNWLFEESTQAVLAGEEPSPDLADWSMVDIWVGIYAIRRDLWDLAGGYDERVGGTAGEDVAFIHACSTLGCMQHVQGEMYHLWHGGEAHTFYWHGDEGTGAGAYNVAYGNPEMMLRLIEEGREWKSRQ